MLGLAARHPVPPDTPCRTVTDQIERACSAPDPDRVPTPDDPPGLRTDRASSPPWTAEETDACFIVRDANGQPLA